MRDSTLTVLLVKVDVLVALLFVVQLAESVTRHTSLESHHAAHHAIHILKINYQSSLYEIHHIQAAPDYCAVADESEPK